MTKTLRTVALGAACLVLFAPTVSAQTHPCDVQAPSAQTIASGAPHRAAFCAPAADTPEAAIAWIDGQAVDLIPVTATSAPSATGDVLYETTTRFLQVARGLHVLEMAIYNRNALTGTLQVGAKSAPFSFAAVDETPLPTAPAITGVTR